MKTTIGVPDRLAREVRRIAVREGVTLRALVERGLRHVVAEAGRCRPFTLRRASFKGRGSQDTVDAQPWETLRDSIYKGRGT
jgi:hypothetical protein